MAGPANTPHTPIRVVCDGKERTFTDPLKARRFYAAQLKAGRQPEVKKS